jgi:LacI family transcriptional regulator
MTIYDIARSAGVSASTVSRVINDKPGVRDTTKKRVKQLLAQYNYSPNAAARSLVNKTSKMVGILIADIRTIHHTDGAYIIQQELTELGYFCIILNTGTQDKSKAEYIKILSQRRVEGAILIGSTFQTEAVAKAIRTYLPTQPIVMSNGFLDLPNVTSVVADEKGGVSRCVDLLVQKGHRRLAFVIDSYTVSNNLKLQGFLEGLQANNLAGGPLVYESGSSLQDAYETTQAILREHPDVDGILYVVDLLAAGGVRALTDLGYQIPGQVAVFGIDNSIYGEICNPRLSSLDNKLVELSTIAGRNLIDALQGRKVTKKMLIFSSIQERETT